MTTLDVRMTNAKKIQTVVTRERKVFYSLCKLLLPIRFETVGEPSMIGKKGGVKFNTVIKFTEGGGSHQSGKIAR